MILQLIQKTVLFVVCLIVLFFFPDIIGHQGKRYVVAQSSEDPYQVFQEGNYEEAAILARRVILSSPSNVEARVVLGWSLLATGNHQEALKISQEALRIAPNDPRLLAITGESHYFLNNWLDALPLLERYVASAPTGSAVARVYSLMGEIFIRFGEYHHADIAFAAATHHDRSVATWWYRRGFVLEQLQQPNDALRAYRQAVALEPTLAEAQNGIRRLQ